MQCNDSFRHDKGLIVRNLSCADPEGGGTGGPDNLQAHQPILWNQPLPYIEGLFFMDYDNVTLPT